MYTSCAAESTSMPAGDPQNIGAQTVGRVGRGMTDLHQEMPVTFELQHVAVGRRIPADPDSVILVYIDPVLGLGPVKTLARSAPGLEQVSLLVKLQDRRRRDATLRAWRCK